MKKIFYILFLLPTLATAQLQKIGGGKNTVQTSSINSDQNYVQTITYRAPFLVSTINLASQDDKIEVIQYVDGLGRVKQTVTINAGGNRESIISHFYYDAIGRRNKEYLPYASSINNGEFESNALSNTNSFYNTLKYEYTTNPYTEKEFDNSPLNRVVELALPGEDWKKTTTILTGGYSNGHTIKTDYKTNGINDVRLFTVSLIQVDDYYAPTLQENGYYTPGALVKSVVKDENWQSDQTYGKDHTTEEFKDKLGRVILKRTYDENVAHETYFIYDNYGNLSYVLSPKMNPEISSLSNLNSQMNELGYQYIYDERNRLIQKRSAGKDWEYFVYDKLNRPVLTQDPLLRESNSWLFTKYDAFDRPVITGKLVTSSSRNTIQNLIEANFPSNTTDRTTSTITVDGQTIYYNYGASYPNSTSVTLHSINYYDDYVNLPVGLGTTITNSYGIISTSSTTDLATVSKTRVLNTNSWITSVVYYDEKARPIYSYTKNDQLQATDIVENKLDDFSGRLMETKSTHKKTGKPDIISIDKFTYDHQDRLLSQKNSINGQSEELIVKNTYDELGVLENKKVGNSELLPLQTIDYKYNIHGWLTKINDVDNIGLDLFTFKINYNKTDILGSVPLFNGNISETSWKTANDNVLRSYAYQYDALNRIKEATYQGGSMTFNENASGPITLSENYSVKNISYDKNGNLNHLDRYGIKGIYAGVGISYSMSIIDGLSYTYETNSNKLKNVSDSADNIFNGNPFSEGSDYGGFHDNHSGDNYTYDANGNLETDANKGITKIEYNHLNLPVKIVFNGKDPLFDMTPTAIEYTYDAMGVKLSKKVYQGVNITVTDYIGKYVYKDNGLQFVFQAEGYINYNSSSGKYEYVYQYKDHLQNVRLSYSDIDKNGLINSNTEILDENNYYIFGLKHKGYNNVITSNGNSVAKKFKYNGKELEESLNLNLYEMDVRFYDPSIARWNAVDPVTHYSLSTYNAFDNNPIFYADPSGADSDPFGGATFAEGHGFLHSIASNVKKDRDDELDEMLGKSDRIRNSISDSKAYENTLLNGVESAARNTDFDTTGRTVLPEVVVTFNDLDSYKRAAGEIAESIYSTDWYKNTYLIAGIYGAGGPYAGDNPRLRSIVEYQGGKMFTSSFGGGDDEVIEYLTSVEKGNVFIRIYGYSRGGNAAVRIANKLGKLGVTIAELTTFDPHHFLDGSFTLKYKDKILHATNYYQRNPRSAGALGWWGSNPYIGGSVRGATNVNYTGNKNVTHLNIIRHTMSLPNWRIYNFN